MTALICARWCRRTGPRTAAPLSMPLGVDESPAPSVNVAPPPPFRGKGSCSGTLGPHLRALILNPDFVCVADEFRWATSTVDRRRLKRHRQLNGVRLARLTITKLFRSRRLDILHRLFLPTVPCSECHFHVTGAAWTAECTAGPVCCSPASRPARRDDPALWSNIRFPTEAMGCPSSLARDAGRVSSLLFPDRPCGRRSVRPRS